MIGPFIVIGMHRSGTSLVTDLLESFGVFMGANKDSNAEALAFQELNRWVLSQVNGSWDFPEALKFLQGRHKALILEFLKRALASEWFAELYFGGRSGFERWGWKDPRNTLLLEFWLSLFPDAKVISVCRHPLSVALSLRNRQKRLLKEVSRRLKSLEGFSPEYLGFKFFGSPRVESVVEGAKLWALYEEEALGWRERLGDRCLFVKYESLLLQPERELHRLASFVGARVTEETIATLSEKFNTDRVKPFTESDEERFWAEAPERVISLASRLGYYNG